MAYRLSRNSVVMKYQVRQEGNGLVVHCVNRQALIAVLKGTFGHTVKAKELTQTFAKRGRGFKAQFGPITVTQVGKRNFGNSKPKRKRN